MRFFFLILIFIFISTSSLLPTSLPSPLLTPFPHLLQTKEQSGFPTLWQVQGPPHSPQVQEGEHTNRQDSHKAHTYSRIKAQRHCPWLLSQPPLPASLFLTTKKAHLAKLGLGVVLVINF